MRGVYSRSVCSVQFPSFGNKCTCTHAREIEWRRDAYERSLERLFHLSCVRGFCVTSHQICRSGLACRTARNCTLLPHILSTAVGRTFTQVKMILEEAFILEKNHANLLFHYIYAKFIQYMRRNIESLARYAALMWSNLKISEIHWNMGQLPFCRACASCSFCSPTWSHMAEVRRLGVFRRRYAMIHPSWASWNDGTAKQDPFFYLLTSTASSMNNAKGKTSCRRRTP